MTHNVAFRLFRLCLTVSNSANRVPIENISNIASSVNCRIWKHVFQLSCGSARLSPRNNFHRKDCIDSKYEGNLIHLTNSAYSGSPAHTTAPRVLHAGPTTAERARDPEHPPGGPRVESKRHAQRASDLKRQRSLRGGVRRDREAVQAEMSPGSRLRTPSALGVSSDAFVGQSGAVKRRKHKTQFLQNASCPTDSQESKCSLR